MFFETMSFKNDMRTEQYMRVKLVGESIIPALEAGDETKINHELEAFKNMSDVEHVTVFDPQGSVEGYFQRWDVLDRNAHDVFSPIGDIGSTHVLFQDGYLYSQVPVISNDQVVGAVMSQSGLGDLRATMRNYCLLYTSPSPRD